MPPVDFSATTENVLKKNTMANGMGMRSHSNSTLPTAFKQQNGRAEKGSLDISYVQEPKNNNE